MGVRIAALLVSIFLLSSCKVFYSNQKKKDIQNLKDLAFCTCININYNRIDSSYSAVFYDVSKSSIFMGAKLNSVQGQLISDYTAKKTSNFYQIENHTTSEFGGKANVIMEACLDFYNSVELEDYIHEIIKKYRKEKIE